MENLPTPATSPPGDSLPTLPGCGRTAAVRFELYSPRESLHGSLDGAVYLCDEHADPSALRETTGLHAFQVSFGADGPKRCGDGFDFLAMRPLVAPDVRAETRHAVADSAAVVESSRPKLAAPPDGDPILSGGQLDAELRDAALRVLFAGNPAVDRAETALRAFGQLDRATAERLLSSWADRFRLSPRERAAVLARFTVRTGHRTRVRQMPGGPVEVRCSCGQYTGTAPTVRAALEGARRHRTESGTVTR
jgi:hypothetical protein